MATKRLQINIALRAAVCLVLLSLADFAICNDKWHVLIGLAIGTGVSVLKFVSYAWAFESSAKTSCSDTQQAVVGMAVLFINLTVLFSALFLSYLHSPRTFMGMTIGILSVPLVLVINAVTEACGVTKNHFFV